MDPAAAERLASVTDPKSLAALKGRLHDPVAAKAVAGQFAAMLVANVVKNSDGTALPIAGDGSAGGIVSGLFAGAISQAIASNDRLGLADLLFRSIEAKERAAPIEHGAQTGSSEPGRDAISKGIGAASAARGSFPLQPYWRENGSRPLAAVMPGAAGDQPATARSGSAPAPGSSTAAMLTDAGPLAAASRVSSNGAAGRIRSFARELRPMLIPAARQLGVSPRILLAHAALETGWGRSMVGNNLFGIKAGASWPGAQVSTATHEVENGERVSQVASFRAYPSLDASVQDYVALVAGSPRYQGLIGLGDDVAAYGRGLVESGYATDTLYQSKLEAIAAEAAAAFATPIQPGPLNLFATPGAFE